MPIFQSPYWYKTPPLPGDDLDSLFIFTDLARLLELIEIASHCLRGAVDHLSQLSQARMGIVDQDVQQLFFGLLACHALQRDPLNGAPGGLGEVPVTSNPNRV